MSQLEPTLTKMLPHMFSTQTSPPLPEQHRIVKKLEQLMQLCDELQQSKIKNEKLLQSALRDALQPKVEVTN